MQNGYIAQRVALIALSATLLFACPAVAQASTTSVKATIRTTLKSLHRSNAQIAAALWIAKRESTYRPHVVSRSGCYGLFQLSRGMAHGHPWWSAVWNTRRADRYVHHRYGSWVRAKRFWQRHHYY